MVNMERFQEPKIEFSVRAYNQCSQADSYLVKNNQVQLMLGVPLELYYGSARVRTFLKLTIERLHTHCTGRCVGSTLQGWSVEALPPRSLTPKPFLLGHQVLVLVFLSDPGKPGVRSMGPDVRHRPCERDLFET